MCPDNNAQRMRDKRSKTRRIGGSCIVRLYPRPEGDATVVGIVESVDDGARSAFASAEELWTFLMRVGRRSASRTKQR